MMIYSFSALLTGFALDLIIGDPQGWPHIVRVMGIMIERLEKMFYSLKNKGAAGCMLTVIVCLVCAALPAVLLLGAWLLSPWIYLTLESFLIWQCLAVKSPRTESGKVFRELEKNDLPAARDALSMKVGRDTAGLG